MTNPPIVVPVPTFRSTSGGLDLDTISRYARMLAGTWTRYVLVSGPMGFGEHSTPAERAAMLDVWLRHIAPGRLIAACWTPDDVRSAHSRRVQLLVMLRADTSAELVAQLDTAPAGSWVYANPRYSRALLTPELISTAAVSGVKLSKVTLGDLEAMRAARPDAVIVHGSSRTIAASLAAGADLVTAASLTVLPMPWPLPDLHAIQDSTDGIQRFLDVLPTHRARVDWIAERASGAAPPPCLGSE